MLSISPQEDKAPKTLITGHAPMTEFADIRPRPGQFVTLKEDRLRQELQDIRVVMNESSRG